jgi:hypothetical protein
MNADFLAELSALMEKHGATLHVGKEVLRIDDGKYKTFGMLRIAVDGKVVGSSIASTLTPIDVATLKTFADLTKL